MAKTRWDTVQIPSPKPSIFIIFIFEYPSFYSFAEGERQKVTDELIELKA